MSRLLTLRPWLEKHATGCCTHSHPPNQPSPLPLSLPRKKSRFPCKVCKYLEQCNFARDYAIHATVIRHSSVRKCTWVPENLKRLKHQWHALKMEIYPCSKRVSSSPAVYDVEGDYSRSLPSCVSSECSTQEQPLSVIIQSRSLPTHDPICFIMCTTCGNRQYWDFYFVL
jgi:hypothetical protein